MVFTKQNISISAAQRAANYYDSGRRRRTFFVRTATAVLLIILAIVGSTTMVDRTPPAVTPLSLPTAIGSLAQSFRFSVEDENSEIASATVDIVHAGTRKRVFQAEFPNSAKKQLIQFMLSAEELGLIDSDVSIELRTADRSFWSNEAVFIEKVAVDYKAPEIVVGKNSSQLGVGDIGWILFEAKDPHFSEAGVKVNGETFYGSPAYLFDGNATDHANLYFSFFAYPLGTKQGVAEVYGKDLAQNVGREKLQIKFRPFSESSFRSDYDAQLIGTVIDPLLEQFFQTGQSQVSAGRIKHLTFSKQLEKKFETVAGDYFDWADRRLKDVLKQTATEALWREQGFFLPKGAKFERRFGSYERFFVGDIFVYQRQIQGDALFSGTKIVQSIARGQVLFSGKLGPYGDVVVIDHGFGLSSVYAYLSKRTVNAGMFLEKGSDLGEVGDFAFAGGKKAELQIRLHGVAVNPANVFATKGFLADFSAQLSELLEGQKESNE